MPIVIYEKGTGRRLFEITAAQRDQLVDALEEEDAEDHDYYVDAAVCDFLDDKVDKPVVAKLRELLGASGGAPAIGADLEAAGDDEEPPAYDEDDEGIEIEWREE
jgi:hypothetical protein